MNTRLKNKSNQSNPCLIIYMNKKNWFLKSERIIKNIIQRTIIQNFSIAIHKAYPFIKSSPAMASVMNDLKRKTYKNMEELREDLSKILFRIYFSEGEYKVYDFYKKEYYDDKKCQALYDSGIYISKEWLDQLMKCLFVKKAGEDMALHNLTPDWLWSHCFRLLIELYELTKQSINK